MEEQPKLLLIVKVSKGMVVRDTPRPESQGGKALRSVPVGAQLYAYGIHYVQNVPYARLVPLNPQRPEWIRVAEADGSSEYVDVIELGEKDNTEALSESVTMLANSITLLATGVREWARK